jgi:uncharacterized protein YcnI
VSQNHRTTPSTTGRTSRSLRRGGATLAALSALTAAGLLAAPAASAHVHVFADGPIDDGYGKLTFRVPNERDNTGTTSIVVTLPESTPLASVSVLPVPGWTATVAKARLAKPVTVNGTTLDEAAHTVTWTAARGAQIAPGQFQEFSISVGPLPETGTLVFPAVQTYSNGEVVNWNQPAEEGGKEPEHPAPSLELAAAGAEGHGDDAAGQEADASAAAPAAASDSGDSDDRSTAALWLSAVALLVGAGGVLVGALGFRRGRQQ